MRARECGAGSVRAHGDRRARSRPSRRAARLRGRRPPLLRRPARIGGAAEAGRARGRGGTWFALGSGQQLHVGVEEDFAPALKAHPALLVAAGELEAVADRQPARADGRAVITLVDYDPAWPERFAVEASRMRGALGARAMAIHHARRAGDRPDAPLPRPPARLARGLRAVPGDEARAGRPRVAEHAGLRRREERRRGGHPYARSRPHAVAHSPRYPRRMFHSIAGAPRPPGPPSLVAAVRERGVHGPRPSGAPQRTASLSAPPCSSSSTSMERCSCAPTWSIATRSPTRSATCGASPTRGRPPCPPPAAR